MKKILLAVTLLFSMNALALDLSNDQVADPTTDAPFITSEIGARDAISISAVSCQFSGTAQSQTFRCSLIRTVGGPEQDLRTEGFGCMFDYEKNADGVTYTRTAWECPIL